MRVRYMLVVLAATVGLAGCNSEYIVKVHNDGDRAVRVRLVQDQVMADSVTLTSATVRPGSAVTLGPVKATATDDVTLEVDSGELGLPAEKQRVSPGSSEYHIGSGTWGGTPITDGK